MFTSLTCTYKHCFGGWSFGVWKLHVGAWSFNLRDSNLKLGIEYFDPFDRHIFDLRGNFQTWNVVWELMDIDECELSSLMFHFNNSGRFVLGFKRSSSNLICCLGAHEHWWVWTMITNFVLEFMDIDECELTSLMFHFNTSNMFVLGFKMSFSNLKCCLEVYEHWWIWNNIINVVLELLKINEFETIS